MKDYQGHKIPLAIKIAWIILLLWVVGYLAVYALPDLMQWLRR